MVFSIKNGVLYIEGCSLCRRTVHSIKKNVYIYTCIYIYNYVYTYIRKNVYTYICMYVYIHIYLSLSLSLSLSLCVCVCVRVYNACTGPRSNAPCVREAAA